MTYATIAALSAWVEQLTLRCWYVFEHYACIKQRFFTDEKKELKDMYREDADGLLALAKHLYEVKNTKGENKWNSLSKKIDPNSQATLDSSPFLYS